MVHRACESITGLVKFADEARIGQLFMLLLQKSTTLIVSQDKIDLDGDLDVNVSIAAQMSNGATQCRNRESLLEALEAICGQERKKVCPTCGEAKVISCFPKDTNPHRISLPCLACGAARKRKYKAERNGQAPKEPSLNQAATG